MARRPRDLQPKHCYHITTRCNNREFRLTRFECREILLYALHTCRNSYGFKLYALCVMSNHIHYLLEPSEPKDLPKIMHWLNWYTAMCFNRNAPMDEIHRVAKKFVLANCLNPEIAALQFPDTT